MLTSDSPGTVAHHDHERSPKPVTAVEPKARQACINCRKQKMRCVPGKGDVCRRCHRGRLSCVFVPRANAAHLPEILDHDAESQFKQHVLERFQIIEDYLGLLPYDTRLNCKDVVGGGETLIPTPQGPLWAAVSVLQKCHKNALDLPIWAPATIEYLWSSFHDQMPTLHFLPDKQIFSKPHPILLASILYCSSKRGTAERVEMAPQYFSVMCSAIAQLSIPGSEVGAVPEIPKLAEEWAFQTVLGIILAALLTEASIREVGIWISIAYRLTLEHCPSRAVDASREWRQLFSGLQIVDLEHASLHMSCPIIPLEAPLLILQHPHYDQIYKLSRMMHTGLSQFTGRKLPTIWSSFDPKPQQRLEPVTNFTAIDAAVIRDWARQLDQWLVEFSNAPEGSEEKRNIVYRQYVLHRLVVLSIYHPARGCDLWAKGVTSAEQQELLLSARATLKLNRHDESIWTNWDLVLITWAALIVLQAVGGSVGEPDDLADVQLHLARLKQAEESDPALWKRLILRLEETLEASQALDPAEFKQCDYEPTSLDCSWQIFDQVSLQNFGVFG